MTLTEVVFCYDSGNLPQESDENLHAIRNRIQAELATAPTHIDSVFCQYLVAKYTEISDYITRTLNTRYGCND